MGKTNLLLRLISVVAALSVFSGVPAAHAQPQPSTIVSTTGLTLDCSSIPNTAQAHQIAASLGICGYGKSGGIHPDNTVYGTCGSLTLTLSQWNHSYVRWYVNITSILGNMDAESYAGSAHNAQTGGGGPVSAIGTQYTTSWDSVQFLYFLPGNIHGEIPPGGAYSHLWWGANCYNASAVTSDIYHY